LAELESAGSELEKLRKDQEDLLELLTDQDARLTHFKAQLRALGKKASNSPIYHLMSSPCFLHIISTEMCQEFSNPRAS